MVQKHFAGSLLLTCSFTVGTILAAENCNSINAITSASKKFEIRKPFSLSRNHSLRKNQEPAVPAHAWNSINF